MSACTPNVFRYNNEEEFEPFGVQGTYVLEVVGGDSWYFRTGTKKNE